jgi:lysophospholipase L1-like esterase
LTQETLAKNKKRGFNMKKMMTMLMALLLCAVMLFTACSETPATTTPAATTTTPAATTTTTPEATTTTTTTTTSTTTKGGGGQQPVSLTTYNLNSSSQVKVTGRQTSLASGIALDHSAATAEFNVTVTAKSDIKVTMSSSATVYFTVFMYNEGTPNNITTKRVCFTNSEKTQTIATSINPGRYNIRLVRNTEAAKGNFTLASISLAGSLRTKTANKSLYIEFIGDSITCGTGNLHKFLNASDPLTILPSASGSCIGPQGDNNPTVEQDASRGYAYLTAQALGADLSQVCQTGIGVYGGWGQMKDVVDKTATNRSGATYTPTRKPDLVVINLGTNDGYTHGSAEYDDEFKAAVKALIAQVRTLYNDPNLKVLWAVGMMNGGRPSVAAEAIREMQNAGDSNVYIFTGFTANSGGHNNHPTYLAHQNAAQALSNYIRQNILTSQ